MKDKHTESNNKSNEFVSHRYCRLCGSMNQAGFKLTFYTDDKGEVSADFQGKPEYQGYEGLLHGGVISALLDSVMTNCLFYAGVEALTADLRIRYLKPVPCCANTTVKARIISQRPPLFKTEAELVVNGEIMVRAKAKFMQRKDSFIVTE